MDTKVYELVNPARCEECGESAQWEVGVGDLSHFYCDDHKPTDSAAHQNCNPEAECDQNTADMSDHVDGHIYHRGTTYDDRSWDARCIRCGQCARLRRAADGIEVLEVW